MNNGLLACHRVHAPTAWNGWNVASGIANGLMADLLSDSRYVGLGVAL